MIRTIDNNFAIDNWNSFASHPLQSWQWGEARKKMGINVVRIAEYLNNQITNVYQMSFHNIPFTNFIIGYLPRSKFPSKQVLEFLYDFGKKNNVIFTKIEPYIEKSQFPSAGWRIKFPITNFNFIESKHPLFPQWTQILDLTISEEELLKNMKSKTRYNINLAVKKGVTVKEESNEKGFKIFQKLYFETCKRQKYFGHTPDYHKIIWENLKNNTAHILIAYYKNIPLICYGIFYFNKIAYYPYGGSSLEYRNLMAANLLMWEAIKLGKKLGAEKFDMWGSLPPGYNQNHPWAGFTRFKEGYGTKFVEMIGSYDLVINNFYYQIYNFVNSLRNIYLKIQRAF